MDQLSPDDLIAACRYELQRVYGKGYANYCLIEYLRGWFYIHLPIKEGNRYKVNPISKPIRRWEVTRIIEKLKKK